MSPLNQDKAEELLYKLFREGQGDVENVDVTGATATFSTPDVHSVSVLTLAHATPAITVPAPTAVGSRKVLYFVQDSSGSRVPSYTGATLTWTNGGAPTLQTAAHAVDRIDLLSVDGTTWYATYAVPS